MLVFDKVNRIGCGEEFVPSIDSSNSFSFSLNNSKYVLFPGFCDVHVHFREPGFSYKETIKSGTRAAAHGGYTAVCTMPNLDPVCDSIEHLAIQEKLILKDAIISVYPYAAISLGQKGEKLADLSSLAKRVIAFSDDGHGVQSESLMREAMEKARSLGKIIVAHCEDNSLLKGGYIHAGSYAAIHKHKGICSESEWVQIKRDLRLAKETGCAYHVCHISTKESVSLIRKAKLAGVDVSCETAPHYLLLDEKDIHEDGKFKMNPPLRSQEDREALLEGLFDGTIDMIATDHAPHSAEEKSRGLAGSAFGIVGIETAFSLLYTGLVRTGQLTLEKLIKLMAINPRKRFAIPLGNDFSIWNLDKEYSVDPSDFLSKGKSTPFAGQTVYGECLLTVHQGKTVYSKNSKENNHG
ncbi:MAG: dihydroorotase [Oscillospiraceae bacterium]|nr:dihydroorotase [Oscillospiraceae bacterium]